MRSAEHDCKPKTAEVDKDHLNRFCRTGIDLQPALHGPVHMPMR